MPFKILVGALLVLIGIAALSGDVLKDYVSVPLADMWLPALLIVAAGTLPALMIVIGSLVIWGELEEKKIERGIIRTEKKLISRSKRKKHKKR